MGFAAFARPALVLHSDSAKICVSDGQWNCGEGECSTPNSVKLFTEKREQGCTRYFAEKADLKWLNKLNANTGLVCSSPSRLLLTHVENDCQQNGVSFDNKKPAILSRAAEKPEILSHGKKVEGAQKTSSYGKTSGKSWNSDSTVNIVPNHSRVVTSSEYEDENCFRGPANKRPGMERSNGAGRLWKVLGAIPAGAVTVASGGAALKGINSGSAQASCGDGGFGHSGSRHGGGGDRNGGGGGGEGGHGGFDAGRDEGFIAESIFYSKEEQDDRKTSVSTSPSMERNEEFRSHEVHDGSDILNWVSGLLDSIMGKRSGDKNCSAQDKLLDDDEKKELVTETAALALKLLSEKGDEFARKFETNALRRLQRETFSDLLKVRERLDRLEHKTGLWGKTHGDSLTGARTKLRGEVSSGGAFIVTEDGALVHSRASLQHAGLKTGLDVRFTFETPMRESDTLTTQVGVGQGSGTGDGNSFGGPLILQKINYVVQISDSLSVTVAPLGARASDMSDTVNHLQGQALTTFAGSGPALYQHCKGSAAGASLRSNTVLLSMSQFLSGWGNTTPDVTPEPVCLSTLAQFMFQPCDQLVLSLSAVNNVWPSPPTPTSNELHWSEMGPLVLCKTITRPTGAFIFNPIRPSAVNSIIAQGNLPTESWSPADSMRNRGIAMQSVALAGEVDLAYRVSLGGWAQVERGDWLSEFEKKEFQWNISIAKCTGRNVNWGLSMGRRKREDWHDDGLSPVISDGPDDPSTSQMHMEAFVRTGCGKGFTLQSGVVYIIDKHSQTPAFMLRSSWTM